MNPQTCGRLCPKCDAASCYRPASHADPRQAPSDCACSAGHRWPLPELRRYVKRRRVDLK